MTWLIACCMMLPTSSQRTQCPFWTIRFIINLSLGVKIDRNHEVPDLLKTVLQEPYFDHNVLIVAAAGNEEKGLPTQYPAAYEFVIGAAATDHNGQQTDYANDGDILAPGGDGDCGETNGNATPANFDCLAVLNSQSQTGASYWKGSSFATPLVSGVIAELLEHDSANILTPSHMKMILQCSTNWQGVINGTNALQKYQNLSNNTHPCLQHINPRHINPPLSQ